MQDVFRESANHCKQGQLFHVKVSREREKERTSRTTKEKYNWFWSKLIQFLEYFKSFLAVLGECLDLGLS